MFLCSAHVTCMIYDVLWICNKLSQVTRIPTIRLVRRERGRKMEWTKKFQHDSVKENSFHNFSCNKARLSAYDFLFAQMIFIFSALSGAEHSNVCLCVEWFMRKGEPMATAKPMLNDTQYDLSFETCHFGSTSQSHYKLYFVALFIANLFINHCMCGADWVCTFVCVVRILCVHSFFLVFVLIWQHVFDGCLSNGIP